MGETTYILIDEQEKRVRVGHYVSLDAFVASLASNPLTIQEFNQSYQQIVGESFYKEGNRPKIPEQLSLDTIRTVLGMMGRSDTDVLEHWKSSSLHTNKNYTSYPPNEPTKYDIPELTRDLIDEWNQEDPKGEDFSTIQDYRRFLCNDGIIVADLRTKELRYISRGAFDIPRSRPTKLDKKFKLRNVSYTLPAEWKIIKE